MADTGHPLVKQAYDLCVEIEKTSSDSSDHDTLVCVMASDLCEAISKFVESSLKETMRSPIKEYDDAAKA